MQGLGRGSPAADGIRHGGVNKPPAKVMKKEGDKMESFDQNVKIHVDTSGLDAAIKKRNNYLHF